MACAVKVLSVTAPSLVTTRIFDMSRVTRKYIKRQLLASQHRLLVPPISWSSGHFGNVRIQEAAVFLKLVPLFRAQYRGETLNDRL